MIVTADHYFKERYAVLTEKSRDLSSMIGYAPINPDSNCLEFSNLCLRPAKSKSFESCRIPRPRALGIYTGLVEAVHEGCRSY